MNEPTDDLITYMAKRQESVNNSEEQDRINQTEKLLIHAITLLSEVRGQHKTCEYIEDALREMNAK